MANGHIFKLKTNSEQLFAIADLGSPMSFLYEKIARHLQQNNKEATFKTIPTGETARNLACYNHETIVPQGKLIIAIESGGWRVQSAPFIVIVDKKAIIIGRNLLPQIGIKLIQEQQKQNVHAIRKLEESDPAIKQEDTPLFRKKLQKVLGVRFIAAATKKDRNLRPLINFVKKRDWEAMKTSYGPYWHNIRNRLHVRKDCLLIDERIVIPTQLRQTVLDYLHLTHPSTYTEPLSTWHKTASSVRNKLKT